MKKMNKDAVANRVQKMLFLRAMVEHDIENYHVKLMKGNSKTGKDCYTVSLIPIADCQNCSACATECYDIRNCCLYPKVQESRAINSAIHHKDIDRYWREISDQVQKLKVKELRINVGGDLNFDDFLFVKHIAKENPECHFLFFTKNYDDLNKFLDSWSFPENVSYIWSRWKGLENNNYHRVPEAHVLYENGDTTAPEYGAYYCTGNCSKCHMKGQGCWALKNGEHVVFRNH